MAETAHVVQLRKKEKQVNMMKIDEAKFARLDPNLTDQEILEELRSLCNDPALLEDYVQVGGWAVDKFLFVRLFPLCFAAGRICLKYFYSVCVLLSEGF